MKKLIRKLFIRTYYVIDRLEKFFHQKSVSHDLDWCWRVSRKLRKFKFSFLENCHRRFDFL